MQMISDKVPHQSWETFDAQQTYLNFIDFACNSLVTLFYDKYKAATVILKYIA